MKGRERFTAEEAQQIWKLLRLVRRAESGTPHKKLRDELRAIGLREELVSSPKAGDKLDAFLSAIVARAAERGKTLLPDGDDQEGASQGPGLDSRTEAPLGDLG